VYRVLEATVAYATLICTFYYYYYYRTVSDISQLIVHIGHFALLSHSLGLRDNVRCSSSAHWKARSRRSGLPKFLLLVLIEVFR